MSLKLGPCSQYEFIVVMKAPTQKRTTPLTSKLNVSLLTYADEKFTVGEGSFEEYLQDEFGGSLEKFLKERKDLGQI